MQRNVQYLFCLLAILLGSIQCAQRPSIPASSNSSAPASKPSLSAALDESFIQSLTKANKDGKDTATLAQDRAKLQQYLRNIRDGRLKLDGTVDDTDCTTLHKAVAFNQLAVVKKLLECGANTNTEDTSRETPLHTAAREGYTEVVVALIQAGAKLDAEDSNGDTPLHGAVREGYINVIKLLVQAGAQTDICNKSRETPKSLAQKRSDIETLLTSSNKKQ